MSKERRTNIHNAIVRHMHIRGLSAKSLAKATGIPEGRVTSHTRSYYSTPKGEDFLAYCEFFGPNFTNVLLEGVGQGGAFDLNGETESVAELNTGIVAAAGKTTTALEDMHIDHKEGRELPEIYRNLACRLLDMAWAMRHPIVTVSAFKPRRAAA